MTSEQDDQRIVVTTRPIVPPYTQQGILRTDNPRLYARPFHIDDLPSLHELRTQIEVMQFTTKGAIDADLSTTRTWMGRFMDLEHDLETAPAEELAQKVQKASSSPASFNFVIVYEEDPTVREVTGDDDADDSRTPSTHKVIGAGGCHSFGTEPEVGYMIRKEYWGKGLVTHFLRAFLAAWWALDRKVVHIPLTTSLHETLTKKRGFKIPEADANTDGTVTIKEYLQALIVTTNTGSRRVLEKCGFQHVWDEEVEERGEQVTLADYMLFRP